MGQSISPGSAQVANENYHHPSKYFYVFHEINWKIIKYLIRTFYSSLIITSGQNPIFLPSMATRPFTWTFKVPPVVAD